MMGRSFSGRSNGLGQRGLPIVALLVLAFSACGSGEEPTSDDEAETAGDGGDGGESEDTGGGDGQGTGGGDGEGAGGQGGASAFEDAAGGLGGDVNLELHLSGGAASGGASGGEEGSGGSESESSTGGTGTSGVGGASIVDDPGCSHSRECQASDWCEPATRECVARASDLTFVDIYQTMQQTGCPACHEPAGPGAVDRFHVGAPLIMENKTNTYAALVAGGFSCGVDGGRICVDDPATSQFVRQTLDLGEAEGKPAIIFGSWSDAPVQEFLQWIAAGAPYDDEAGICGDYVVDAGEDCDEGDSPTDHCAYGLATCEICTPTCTVGLAVGAVCGDSVIDTPYETCDDGNALDELCSDQAGCAICNFECRIVEGEIGAPQ